MSQNPKSPIGQLKSYNSKIRNGTRKREGHNNTPSLTYTHTYTLLSQLSETLNIKIRIKVTNQFFF